MPGAIPSCGESGCCHNRCAQGIDTLWERAGKARGAILDKSVLSSGRCCGELSGLGYSRCTSSRVDTSLCSRKHARVACVEVGLTGESVGGAGHLLLLPSLCSEDPLLSGIFPFSRLPRWCVLSAQGSSGPTMRFSALDVDLEIAEFQVSSDFEILIVQTAQLRP